MSANAKTNALHSVPRAEVSADKWDAVVCNSPDGWVFGLYGWQELILAVQRWQLQDFSFALRENARLVAVVPLQFSPLSGIVASSGWGGTGPIIDGGLSDKARQRVMEAAVDYCIGVAKQCGARSLEIALSGVTKTSINAPWGVNPLIPYGFEDKSGLTQVIQLGKEEDELWRELSESSRRKIKKALKNGYHVEKVNWEKYLDFYYEIHVENYNRTGVHAHPFEYFKGISEETFVSGNSVLFAAFGADGVPVAFQNDARFGIGAFFHTGCARSAVLASGVNYLLKWEAIKSARNNGFQWYEVGWIFPHTDVQKLRGLTDHKTRFGGQPHRLFRGSMEFTSPDTNSPMEGATSRLGKFCRMLGQTVPWRVDWKRGDH